MARGGGPKAKKEMLSSWLERQARVHAKELKKAHTTRAAKQGNARPPSVRVAKGVPKAKKANGGAGSPARCELCHRACPPPPS